MFHLETLSLIVVGIFESSSGFCVFGIVGIRYIRVKPQAIPISFISIHIFYTQRRKNKRTINSFTKEYWNQQLSMFCEIDFKTLTAICTFLPTNIFIRKIQKSKLENLQSFFEYWKLFNRICFFSSFLFFHFFFSFFGIPLAFSSWQLIPFHPNYLWLKQIHFEATKLFWKPQCNAVKNEPVNREYIYCMTFDEHMGKQHRCNKSLS